MWWFVSRKCFYPAGRKQTENMSETIKTGASFNRASSRQDYITPPDFIAAVQNRFGSINCDLAASKENAHGPMWIDKDHDSLSEQVSWHKIPGILWLNPPFSDITPWAEKCASEGSRGAKILFLTPASVGSNWFMNFVFPFAHVLFLNGRIKFVGCKDYYPKDCMLSCYGFVKTGIDIWKWNIY